jgi:Glycosyl transferase family 90
MALFQKLLTGSPVLKVASPDGYRQWLYGLLHTRIDYIPVASDSSDLVEKTRWVLATEDAAQEIGERGRALALSLTYESQSVEATRTIAGAFRCFNPPKNGRRRPAMSDGAASGVGVLSQISGWWQLDVCLRAADFGGAAGVDRVQGQPF